MSRLRFSKTSLLTVGLPPAGCRTTIYDTDVPKLALRVTHSGAKSFYVVKRTATGVAWVKLGAFPEMTVEQARKAAEMTLGEFAAGANPTAARRAHRGEMTLQELFDHYLSNKRKRDGSLLSARTVAEYQQNARRYLAKLMPRKLSEVGHERVAQLHRKIGKEAPYAANRTKALVSALFNYAHDQRLYVGENPTAGLRSFAEESRDRFALPDELPHLFSAIAQSNQGDFFLLALLTGARRSNVQAMAWRDVDFERGVWRIGKTKNGTPQNVPLTTEAKAILRARKEAMRTPSAFVFPGRGKTGHLQEPVQSWTTIKRTASLSRLLATMQSAGHLSEEKRAAAEAQALENLAKAERKYHAQAAAVGIDPDELSVSDLRIHDLRRTLGSWQAMTGASLSIIGKSLNHKSQQATASYARLDLDPIRQSVTTATSAMLEAAGLKTNTEAKLKLGK